jgi:hypothetical protein
LSRKNERKEMRTEKEIRHKLRELEQLDRSLFYAVTKGNLIQNRDKIFTILLVNVVKLSGSFFTKLFM